MASFTSPPRTQRPVARQPPQATQPPICSAPTVRICTSAPAVRSTRSISCRAVYVQPRGCGLPLIMRIFIVSPHAQDSINRRGAQGGAQAENRDPRSVGTVPDTGSEDAHDGHPVVLRTAGGILRRKQQSPRRPVAFGAVFSIWGSALAHMHISRGRGTARTSR